MIKRLIIALQRGMLSGLAALSVVGSPAIAQTGDSIDLAGALRATLRSHPAITGQQAKIDAFSYAADGARSQRLPIISAQLQQYAQGGRSSVTGDDLSRPAIFRVRQPVWSFGRIKHDIAYADSAVRLETADLLRLRRQLLEATATAYVLARGGAQRVDAARVNVSAHETLLAQIQRRAQGQLASSVDEQLAASRLVQARSLYKRASADLEAARAELHALTQMPLGTLSAVPHALVNVSAALIEQALEQHADLRLKRQQLNVAQAEVKRAESAAMPTIYLQADRLHDQPALVDDNQVSVVFEASLDGLGFAARASKKGASAGRYAAQKDLEVARMETRLALEGLLRKQRLEAELVEMQTLGMSEMQSLLASYRRQYASGSKSWLDVMNLQREVFELSTQLVQTRMDFVIYSLQLQARLGGLDSYAGLVYE